LEFLVFFFTFTPIDCRDGVLEASASARGGLEAVFLTGSALPRPHTVRLASVVARSGIWPGLSQADCLWDESPVGTGPKMVSQRSSCDWKTESTWEKWLGRIVAWNQGRI